MAIRKILLHPDPRLRKRADAVADDDASALALIDDMFETMYDAPGIGLAAPQIGVMKRVLVMDCAGRDDTEEALDAAPDPIAMINPALISASTETAINVEGCLSIPDFLENVSRAAVVTARYTDRDGVVRERELRGVSAVCFQHELDHLNGKLFIDYIGPVKRSMITARMRKLKRERARGKGGA